MLLSSFRWHRQHAHAAFVGAILPFSHSRHASLAGFPSMAPLRACVSTGPNTLSKESQVMQRVRSRLQDELPTIFTADTPDYSLYSRDVTFEDPLNKFSGTGRYAANIKFLANSPVFSDARFELHDTAILPDAPNTIRTRWTLSMVMRLPWRPRVAFTGQSDYVVDIESESVIEHRDYWDSIDNNAFLSTEAIKDLVSQLSPSQLRSPEIPPYHLLRRTAQFHVWKFQTRVTLLNDPRLSTWRIISPSSPVTESSLETESLTFAAVVAAGDRRPSDAQLQITVERLHSELTTNPYAQSSGDVFCINLGHSQKPHYQIWIKLDSVRTDVEP